MYLPGRVSFLLSCYILYWCRVYFSGFISGDFSVLKRVVLLSPAWTTTTAYRIVLNWSQHFDSLLPWFESMWIAFPWLSPVAVFLRHMIMSQILSLCSLHKFLRPFLNASWFITRKYISINNNHDYTLKALLFTQVQ